MSFNDDLPILVEGLKMLYREIDRIEDTLTCENCDTFNRGYGRNTQHYWRGPFCSKDCAENFGRKAIGELRDLKAENENLKAQNRRLRCLPV